MVGFGQTICTPINPSCDVCYNNDVCPYGKVQNNKLLTKKEDDDDSKTSKPKKGSRGKKGQGKSAIECNFQGVSSLYFQGASEMKNLGKFDAGEGSSYQKLPTDPYSYEINFLKKFIIDRQEMMVPPQLGIDKDQPMFNVFSDD